MVWALAVLQEEQAKDAIIQHFAAGTLQDKPRFDRRVIANVLGPEALGQDSLLFHESTAVRALTAQSLADLASKDTVAPLTKQLKFELNQPKSKRSLEVIRSIAAGLGRSGDAGAAEPLFDLLQQQPAMRVAILDSLSKSTSAPGLASLLKRTTDPQIRRELLAMVAQARDVRAVDTLAKYASSGKPRQRLSAAMGLAAVRDPRAKAPLLELAEGKPSDIALMALESLRAVAAPEHTQRLAKIATTYPARKSAVLRALGATGDPAASPIIERELQGDDAGSAALALAQLKSATGYAKLLRMATRPRNLDMSKPSVKNETVLSNRLAAIRALGRYADPKSNKTLQAIVEDTKDDGRIRATAAAALGPTADAALINSILENPSAEGNEYYAPTIAQQAKPELQSALVAAIQGTSHPAIRRGAAIALGYATPPNDDSRIVDLLKDTNTRRAGAIATLSGGGSSATAALLELLERDRDLRDWLEFTTTSEQSPRAANADRLDVHVEPDLAARRHRRQAPRRGDEKRLWLRLEVHRRRVSTRLGRPARYRRTRESRETQKSTRAQRRRGAPLRGRATRRTCGAGRVASRTRRRWSRRTSRRRCAARHGSGPLTVRGDRTIPVRRRTARSRFRRRSPARPSINSI